MAAEEQLSALCHRLSTKRERMRELDANFRTSCLEHGWNDEPEDDEEAEERRRRAEHDSSNAWLVVNPPDQRLVEFANAHRRLMQAMIELPDPLMLACNHGSWDAEEKVSCLESAVQLLSQIEFYVAEVQESVERDGSKGLEAIVTKECEGPDMRPFMSSPVPSDSRCFSDDEISDNPSPRSLARISAPPSLPSHSQVTRVKMDQAPSSSSSRLTRSNTMPARRSTSERSTSSGWMSSSVRSSSTSRSSSRTASPDRAQSTRSANSSTTSVSTYKSLDEKPLPPRPKSDPSPLSGDMTLEQEVILILRTNRLTSKELLSRLRRRLRENPRNKIIIPAIINRVAISRDGVLELKYGL